MTDTHPTGDQHWATVPACLPARYCLLACPPSRSPYPLTHLPACSLLLACLLTCLLACLPARPTTHPPACLLTIACLLFCLVFLVNCGYFWCRILNSFNNKIDLFHWQANLRKWAKTYVDSIKKS